MTEFEMATLAVQRMGVLVAALVGFSQCALIGGGLFMMRRAAIMRDRALDELIRGTRTNHEEVMTNHEEVMTNHEQSMANHEEVMAAFQTDREHNMENHEQYMANHRETMAKHEESMAALHELIRRTSKAGE